MKKIAFSVLLLLYTLSIFSQKTVAVTSNMELKNKREAVPIINTKTNDLSLFITDRKKIYHKKYNDEFELIDEETFDRPKSLLKNIKKAINTSENEYIFLLSNNQHKSFGLLKINSGEKSIKILTDSIKFNTDKYLLTIKNNNQIYVITIKENQSDLNIHKINADGSLKSMRYKLANEDFFDKQNNKVSLYEALLNRVNYLDPGRLALEYIDTSIPNSLEKTSKKTKLFVDGNKIMLLLDQSVKFSQIITIDLDSNSYKVDTIKKVVLSNYTYVRSNSFIFENNLYQLVASKDRMKFSITNISSKKVLKEIHLNQNDSITFKNAPIVQEGGTYTDYREMEKTQKFLRKIAVADVGVSVYKSNDNLQITLGGIKELKGAPMGPGFGPAGSIGTFMNFSTHTFYAFYSYVRSKSTYIKCLFDKNLSHISGEIRSNGFDRIKAFKKEILDENTETIFKFNNRLIYGYYYPKHHAYYLRKFED